MPWLFAAISSRASTKLISEGYIALQAETAPIDFREVEVLDLKGCMDPEARNCRSYIEERDPGACRYDGASP